MICNFHENPCHIFLEGMYVLDEAHMRKFIEWKKQLIGNWEERRETRQNQTINDTKYKLPTYTIFCNAPITNMYLVQYLILDVWIFLDLHDFLL